MQSAPSNLHVYQRHLSLDASNSLGLLAQWIAPEACVLDLGCGAGGLGQLLRQRGTDHIDGITYNPAEAEAARQWYRRVEVADLDQCDLLTLLGEQRYDVIVCADVLEHLRSPERLLAQCRRHLKPGGQLLASIPNAGHAGLIGELMGGRLQYREEGLLDRTHLRFFTRRSWLGFLAEQGWGAMRLEGIQRDVPQTEFELAFDLLPTAVSHYLCTLPDAQTYQFITACVPDAPHSPDLLPPPQPLPPSFGTTLYWDLGQGFQEAQKLQLSGVIGEAFQTLSYPLPTQAGLCGLRLDPSDRPGFMRWHRLELLDAAGQRLWEADCRQKGPAALADCALHQISLAPAMDAQSGVLSVLEGVDPWLELPRQLPWQALMGGTLQISLGWPASTDYLALLEHLRRMQPSAQELAHLREAWAVNQDHTRQLEQQLAAMQGEWRHEHEQAVARHERLQQLQAEHEHTLQALQQSQEALRQSREALQAAQAHPLRRLIRLARRSLASFAPQRTGSPPAGAQAVPHAAPTPTAAPSPSLSPIPAPAPDGVSALAGQRASVAVPAPAPATVAHPMAPTVDIIVPVYRGLNDTRQCLESVLAHHQNTPTRLIVINDASPEPALSEWLRQWASTHPEVTLLENDSNLGFVATVNRGMALSEAHDVLLLNSDTEVANDWLDRLRRAAYSAPQVSSVTPFSNNATICSYPRFCEPNELPDGLDTAALDQLLARQLAGQTVDIPTAIGFCMYIRRDCLQAVGLFDVAHFGKGYGEENDFCCRASAAGWRHLHALDTFVLHRGGVSFGDSKNERERTALRTLRRLHPGYEAEVQRFVNADPAHPARQQIDLLRLEATGRPKVLAVSHNAGGGTLQHIRELAVQLRQQADFLLLRPYEGGVLKLSCVDPREGYLETFQLPDDAQALRDRLRQLGVVLVHYHHLLDHGSEVLNLPRDLGVPADFTAHDYYTLCPQVSLVDANARYCGELGLSQCARCLEERPAPDHKTIEVWRRDHRTILQRMRHVLAPSIDTARRMRSFVPQADLRLAPHPDLPTGQALPNPNPKPLPAGARLKVAVIGALNPLKGADLLEQTALLAARQGAAIDFHLLGHAYRDLSTQPRAHLSVHGRYQTDELAALLSWLQPDLVWFPVQAPETYSYTLSACLQAGLPIVAPDLGAFPARLAGRPWTWIQAWDTDAAGWLGVFQALMEKHFSTGQPPSLPGLASSQFDTLQPPLFDYQNDYLPSPGAAGSGPTTIG